MSGARVHWRWSPTSLGQVPHSMGRLTGCHWGQISIVTHGRPLVVLWVCLSMRIVGSVVICSFPETQSQDLTCSDLVWWSWDVQHGFREPNMGPVWMHLPPKSFWGKEMDHNSLFSYLPKMIMRDKAGKRWGCFLEHLLGKRDTVILLLPENAIRARGAISPVRTQCTVTLRDLVKYLDNLWYYFESEWTS